MNSDTVKCPSCGTELVREPGVERPDACPFCGAALARPPAASGSDRAARAAPPRGGAPAAWPVPTWSARPGRDPDLDFAAGGEAGAAEAPEPRPGPAGAPEAAAAPAADGPPLELVEDSRAAITRRAAAVRSPGGPPSQPSEPRAKAAQRRGGVVFRDQVLEYVLHPTRRPGALLVGWVVGSASLACAFTGLLVAGWALLGGDIGRLAPALWLVMIAVLGGAGAGYVLRGYPVSWLCGRALALAGLMAGTPAVVLPLIPAIREGGLGRGPAPLAGALGGILCGVVLVMLSLEALARKAWALRCMALALLVAGAVAAGQTLGAGGSAAAGLVWQAGLLWRAAPVAIGSALLAAAAAAGMPLFAYAPLPGPERQARRVLLRGLGGIGLTLLSIGLVLCGFLVGNARGAAALLELGWTAAAAVAAAVLLAGALQAWCSGVLAEYDALSAARFSWVATAVVAALVAVCTVPRLAGPQPEAAVLAGLAAVLVLACCLLGRKGAAWPHLWFAVPAVLAVLSLVGRADGCVRTVEAGLAGLPSPLAHGLALAAWATAACVAGYACAGFLIRSAAEYRDSEDVGPAVFVLIAGFALSFTLLAAGLALSAGDAAVRGAVAACVSSAARNVKLGLSLVVGPVFGGRADPAVDWLRDAVLGRRGAAGAAAVYGTAGILLLAHMLAAKAVRTALRVVAVFWTLAGLALLGTAVALAVRALGLDEHMTAGPGWAGWIAGDRLARLCAVAAAALAAVKVLHSTGACLTLGLGLEGPRSAEYAGRSPGAAGREIVHLRNAGLVMGVVLMVLGLAVSPSIEVAVCLDRVASGGRAVAEVFGLLAEGLVEIAQRGGLMAASCFAVLYLLLAFHRGGCRRRLSTFPWIAGLWTGLVTAAGVGLAGSVFAGAEPRSAGALAGLCVHALVWAALAVMTVRLWLAWGRLAAVHGLWDDAPEARTARDGEAAVVPGVLGMLLVAALAALMALASLGKPAWLAGAEARLVRAAAGVARWAAGTARAPQGGVWSAVLVFAGALLTGLHLVLATGGRTIRFVVAGTWTLVLLGVVGLGGYWAALQQGVRLSEARTAVLVAAAYGVIALLSANVSAWTHLLAAPRPSER